MGPRLFSPSPSRRSSSYCHADSSATDAGRVQQHICYGRGADSLLWPIATDCLRGTWKCVLKPSRMLISVSGDIRGSSDVHNGLVRPPSYFRRPKHSCGFLSQFATDRDSDRLACFGLRLDCFLISGNI